tara:strand:+ start:418 stop:858 length:441 start_codon:yes stop_codon:yes gene_type:complete
MIKKLEVMVRTEIEDLHQFFVGWFSGALDTNSFDEGFLARFDPDFLLIPPAGIILSLEELNTGIRNTHNTNPDFRIAIRNVKIQRVLESEIIATYEEWQRNARASTPPDNGRLATVIFKKSDPLKWLHVHETWMPESIQTAGPFDF